MVLELYRLFADLNIQIDYNAILDTANRDNLRLIYILIILAIVDMSLSYCWSAPPHVLALYHY